MAHASPLTGSASEWTHAPGSTAGPFSSTRRGGPHLVATRNIAAPASAASARSRGHGALQAFGQAHAPEVSTRKSCCSAPSVQAIPPGFTKRSFTLAQQTKDHDEVFLPNHWRRIDQPRARPLPTGPAGNPAVGPRRSPRDQTFVRRPLHCSDVCRIVDRKRPGSWGGLPRRSANTTSPVLPNSGGHRRPSGIPPGPVCS